jgi:hypothetical protein
MKVDLQRLQQAEIASKMHILAFKISKIFPGLYPRIPFDEGRRKAWTRREGKGCKREVGREGEGRGGNEGMGGKGKKGLVNRKGMGKERERREGNKKRVRKKRERKRKRGRSRLGSQSIFKRKSLLHLWLAYAHYRSSIELYFLGETQRFAFSVMAGSDLTHRTRTGPFLDPHLTDTVDGQDSCRTRPPAVRRF